MTPAQLRAFAAEVATVALDGNKSAAGRLVAGIAGGSARAVKNLIVGRDLEAIRAHVAELIREGDDPAAREATVPELVALQASHDAEADLRKVNKRLVREIATLSRWHEMAGEAFAKREAPKPILARQFRAGRAVWVLFVSDIHLGKSVDPDHVAGVNAYSVKIARSRTREFFEKAAALMKRAGAEVEALVLICGGDNVNGELHEDAETNEITPANQVRVVAREIASGVEFLAAEFPDVAIDVDVLPGNHGRMRKAPPSARVTELNFDTLVGDLLEAYLGEFDRITVRVPPDGNSHRLVFSWGLYSHHGDKYGRGGGDGQIGAIGPIARGSLQIREFFETLRRTDPAALPVHYMLSGHFHDLVEWRGTFGNGSIIGPEPWSAMDRRFAPQRPAQRVLGFHPERGLIHRIVIDLGKPEEGSICKPGEPDPAIIARFEAQQVAQLRARGVSNA